jgi:transcriptional regulator with XRE-family HTH domain
MSKETPKTGPLVADPAADPAADLAGHVQVIEQDGEPRFAVVPWKDWRAIAAALENQADADLVARSEARIATGEETIPGEVINAILLEGATPLAAYRKWRGLKQVELAARAGLNQAYVSELEAGKKTPSLEALQDLAAALDLDVGLLIPPRAAGEETEAAPAAKPKAVRGKAVRVAKAQKKAKPVAAIAAGKDVRAVKTAAAGRAPARKAVPKAGSKRQSG